jgi:hypothetical protein
LLKSYNPNGLFNEAMYKIFMPNVKTSFFNNKF